MSSLVSESDYIDLLSDKPVVDSSNKNWTKLKPRKWLEKVESKNWIVYWKIMKNICQQQN